MSNFASKMHLGLNKKENNSFSKQDVQNTIENLKYFYQNDSQLKETHNELTNELKEKYDRLDHLQKLELEFKKAGQRRAKIASMGIVAVLCG